MSYHNDKYTIPCEVCGTAVGEGEDEPGACPECGGESCPYCGESYTVGSDHVPRPTCTCEE